MVWLQSNVDPSNCKTSNGSPMAGGKMNAEFKVLGFFVSGGTFYGCK